MLARRSIGLFLLLVSAFAHSQWRISGSLLGDSGKALADAQITINGASATSQPSGAFSVALEIADTYRVSINRDGYYDAYQVFSHAELINRGWIADGQLEPIELVKRKSGRVMFTFSGDAMMGRRYWQPKFGDPVLIDEQDTLADTKAIVAHMKPYLERADFAVVNLETQIAKSEPQQRAPKSVTFYSPPETLDALEWAGVDYVTLGNNHTYDYLDEGLQSTLTFLDASSLGYSGADADQQHALAAFPYQSAGHTYDMFGYVGWEGGFTPNQVAEKDKGGAAFGNMQNIASSVNASVQQNHFPIVQYHGSLEYGDEPSGVTEQRLKRAIDQGAVMAIAHHPHVTQGIELYNGKLIAYSMGNFIFDQYFYSTGFSYLLNVWMDGERFHRAEIVPIYLRGYKPVPATGTSRYTVLKRVKTLSELRGTEVVPSGGHGMIRSANEREHRLANNVRLEADGNTAISLFSLPWHQDISSITVPANSQYRLGTVLSNGGDFEDHQRFDSPERGWMFDNADHTLITQSGNKRLTLIKRAGKSRIGMKNFRRVYQASNPGTVTFDIKAEKDTKVSVFWQGRKTRQKFHDALDNSPLNLIGTVDIQAGEQRRANLDFNSPRIGHRSYRILLDIESDAQSIDVDNLHLIEWQSAFSNQPLPAQMNSHVKQASFIGLDRAVDAGITLTLD